MQAVLSFHFGTNGVRVGVFGIDSHLAATVCEVDYPTRLIQPNPAAGCSSPGHGR